MATKTVSFNYRADVEKHPTSIEKCPVSYCNPHPKICSTILLPILDKVCSSCSDIVLTLKDSADVVQNCLASTNKQIYGTITERTQLTDSNGCPMSQWRYTVSYDDSQLTTPADGILPCDIDTFSCFDEADKYLLGLIECLNGTVFPAALECPAGFFVGAPI